MNAERRHYNLPACESVFSTRASLCALTSSCTPKSNNGPVLPWAFFLMSAWKVTWCGMIVSSFTYMRLVNEMFLRGRARAEVLEGVCSGKGQQLDCISYQYR